MTGILKHKWFLYLTEFFSGMSVMAVELGASRLLAPYFSSSQIVWTIIIGTIMIAMALGNLYGGRSADKNPDPDVLYRRIFLAALWIALIPVLGKYIVLGISAVLIFAVDTGFLIWAAFTACIVLFVFPLFLLGTVTPSLTRYSVDNLNDSGRIVGTLGAFNTIGSILGTFLPTFVTIPSVGTSVSFLIFSGILLLLSAVYFIVRRKFQRKLFVGFLIFILCLIFGRSDSFAFWENDLTYEGESIYNYLQVKDTENETILSTNVLFGVQSITMKNNELTGLYYDYALAAPLMTSKTDTSQNRILILGMGTGTFARQCREYLDISSIQGVEIDGKITELSTKYFDFPEDIPVNTYDGRAYLNAIDETYDVIMVDAYQDITIPFQMSSIEFFTLVKNHLSEDGVMVVNMNMRSSEEGNINQYLSDTISAVFPQVYTVAVSGTTNQELFAGCSSQMLSSLSANSKTLTDSSLISLMEEVSSNLVSYEHGSYLMTDDNAPVELLGMQVIDELIQEEVSYYKRIYESEGLRAVIDLVL